MLKHSIFAILAFTLSSQAAVLYDNGTFNASGSWSIGAARVADDFVLAGNVSVSGVQFFYHWVDPSVPNSATNFSGTISYAIYNNNAGSIGSLVSSGSVSGLTSTDTGIGMLGFQGTFHSLTFNLPAPLALTAGTYWLELHEGPTLSTNDGTQIGWAVASRPGNAKQGLAVNGIPVNSTLEEMSFQLLGDVGGATATPEPETVLLSAMGVAVLAFFRKK